MPGLLAAATATELPSQAPPRRRRSLIASPPSVPFRLSPARPWWGQRKTELRPGARAWLRRPSASGGALRGLPAYRPDVPRWFAPSLTGVSLLAREIGGNGDSEIAEARQGGFETSVQSPLNFLTPKVLRPTTANPFPFCQKRRGHISALDAL